jgi:hypothetical protein
VGEEKFKYRLKIVTYGFLVMVFMSNIYIIHKNIFSCHRYSNTVSEASASFLRSNQRNN